MARLSRKVILFRTSCDGMFQSPEFRADDPLLLRGDRNGVDIDREMTALAKNSLLYKASSQIVAAKFSGLKNVITGGSK
jgi:flagellar basal-body rod protein FlgB